MALMSPGIGMAVRLLLVTAQRRAEVAEAPWTEFDLANAVWTISSERTKNRLVHLVPLSPLAITLLREIKSMSGESPWLFPSPRRDGPITAPSVTQAFRDNRTDLQVGDATVHDLRRTSGTRMSEMGISRFIVKRVLNHVERDVTDIYDRYAYLAEERHAIEAWARRIEQVVAGEPLGNVLPFRPAAS
jgi:integrase